MYLRKIWFLPLLLVVSIESSPSPQPPYDYESTARSVPAVVPQVVYTADRNREEPQQYDRVRDSELFPSTATTGTARTTHGGEGDGGRDSPEEPENTGFVEPIDFGSLLSGIGSYSGGKQNNIAAESSNPFSSSDSKDRFANFFGDSKNKNNIFVEPNFGSLSASSSNQNNQKVQEEDDIGFVDPNVQFRSLFDSPETSTGFRPQDFLNTKDDSVGVDPSKGSQTRAFPSFTYSGRQSEEDTYNAPEDPKYRSSYRQVGNPQREYSNDDQGEGGRQGSNGDPYDDRNFYNGQRDRSPPPPPNPNPRYNQQQASAPQRAQETAHSPKASANTPKNTEAKPKCKKVEKQVDYNDDYAAYTDPEPDYDPASYSTRYKRQARGRQGGGKRPMTCYVCEDEAGRYAERCSYDSKADPKKGNYFHSTSSSYNDNGRRPSGGRERQRRNPTLKAAASATTTATVSSTPTTQDPLSGPLEEPKRLDKRQSGTGRYASNFGSNNNRDGGGRGRNEDGFGGAGRGGFDNAPGRGGGNGGGNDGFDDDFGNGGFRGTGGGRRLSASRPSHNNNNGGGGGGGGGRGRVDDFGIGEFENSPEGRDTQSEHERRESALEREFGPPSQTASSRRQDNDPNYGFVEPRGGGARGGNNNRNRDFDFGPPSDFGRDTSASNTNNQGFNFDFSIPREFDPDVQLRTANSNPSPNLLHTSATNNNNDNNFDSGYDDYIKRYFPDAFGSSTPASSPSTSSFRPSHGPPQHSPTSHRTPDREHTQQSNNFAPPPYFQNGDSNGEHLEKLVGAFSSRDRSGCEKVQKGDMTCYVCKDPSGMQKEECMYASNDPRNKQMAYHEVTEYSSLPPASILPLPRPELATAASATSSVLISSTSPSPMASSLSQPKLPPSPSTSSSHSLTKESRIVETKVKQSPIDYDFDY